MNSARDPWSGSTDSSHTFRPAPRYRGDDICAIDRRIRYEASSRCRPDGSLGFRRTALHTPCLIEFPNESFLHQGTLDLQVQHGQRLCDIEPSQPHLHFVEFVLCSLSTAGYHSVDGIAYEAFSIRILGVRVCSTVVPPSVPVHSNPPKLPRTTVFFITSCGQLKDASYQTHPGTQSLSMYPHGGSHPPLLRTRR